MGMHDPFAESPGFEEQRGGHGGDAERLAKLQERLGKLEASPEPNLMAISELASEIEAIKAAMAGASPAPADGEDAAFKDWMQETGRRYVDPSTYGDGPAVLQGEVPKIPKPQAPAAGKQAAKPSSPDNADAGDAKRELEEPRLVESLDKVKSYIVTNTIKGVYKQFTRNGKTSLKAAISETTLGQGAKLKQFTFALRREVQAVFEKLGYPKEVRTEIVYHLVLEIEEDYKTVTETDTGSMRIIRTVLAREFLSEGVQNKLRQQGVI